jgi:glycosyltransferase involved in cell wall biosynthesis
VRSQRLVSIITATYNHERFIGQCIESVLVQSYTNWEQIIIDDGSTDRTGEIVGRYKDKRIRYIRQDNVGIWRLSETYNKALQAAEGEFIAILEGDDFWPPRKLEIQTPALDRKEIVLSWGKMGIADSEGKTTTVSPRNLRWFSNKSGGEILRRLLLQGFIGACTVMCRKDALLAVGGFRQLERAPIVDYPTWLELGLVGEFQPVDEVLGYWRQHQGQTSTKLALEMAQACSFAIDLFNRMPQELRDSTGLSLRDLLDNQQKRLAIAHLRLGRVGLIDGRYEQARAEFREASKASSAYIKLIALLGSVCSYCKVDLEWGAAVTHRPRLK